MAYVIGLDVGGTFTDCVVMRDDGRLTVSKTLSTPEDLSQCFLETLELAAGNVGIGVGELLRQTALILYGTTVGINTVLQRTGSKTGLITTRGHRDVMHMMRGHGRVAGLPVHEVLHSSKADKPDPLVPKTLIQEVSERIDCKGQVVVALNEEEARRAIKNLVTNGVEAVAIAFLWSIANPAHELKVKELCLNMAPNLFISCSSDVAPRMGEYERTTATVINSYIGPISVRNLRSTDAKLRTLGFARPLFIMQCIGGAAPLNEVERYPLLTLGSGPVGGIMGSAYLASLLGHNNVISTDMGGTSFDVGVIREGVPTVKHTNIVGQYEYYVHDVDVRSIGNGGGSIISVDPTTKVMTVGPESAGAKPGPVCCGWGGTRPTVTDADVVLGYINPEYFLGGRFKLSKRAAEEKLAKLGATLGMSATEVAAGAYKIVNLRMADLIRQMTIEKGYDPRDFVVYIYGGAGPVHGGKYAKETGCKFGLIPLGGLCSAWSALGIASSDILHVFEEPYVRRAPLDPDDLGSHLGKLEAKAKEQLRREGFSDDNISMNRFADMKYGLQIHEVETPIAGSNITKAEAKQLCVKFEEIYESVYGKGSGFSGAGIITVALRVKAVGRIPKIHLSKEEHLLGEPPKESSVPSRHVYWPEIGRFVSTPIYRGEKMRPGNEVKGPTVIDMPNTSIVIHPGQTCRVDAFGNFVIQLA